MDSHASPDGLEPLLRAWAEDVDFERLTRGDRLVKALCINPFGNYAPPPLVRGLLRLGKSELAAANWADPGGWRSMVISYENRARQVADKALVSGGTIPTALRNRRRLAGQFLAGLIDRCPHPAPHVLCLGAGPGRIILDALSRARDDAHATLVDLNPDAFPYGKRLAAELGLSDRVRYICDDVRNVERLLDTPPDIVKMIGICEYLTDAQIRDILSTVTAVMRDGGHIVFNSISPAHGTDRFCRRVFGLHMTYRTPQELATVMSPTGLGDFASIREPLGVYHVCVGRKLR
ncbi:MAG: class I SAM-dependent methyltransferase [Phycisphaerae bacterium]|nr:class I SAM-dependent methyltransferase [Phycisphaerae bacterium]